MDINISKTRIIVDYEDKDNMKDIFSKFLNDLENCDSLFKKDRDKIDKKFREFKENLKNEKEKEKKKFLRQKLKSKQENSFSPEALYSECPITMLSGEWGTGKTFFVEELIYFFYLNKNDQYFFEEILTINLFNFFGSKNFDIEIINNILNQISSVIKKEKTRKKFKIIFKKLLQSFVPKKMWITFPLESVDTINDKYIDKLKNLWGKDSMPKTIIFLDNFERIGSDCWNVIKLIRRALNFKNLIFIIVVNLSEFNKLNDNTREFPIEKFITSSYFAIEQKSFKDILKDIRIKSNYIETFNKLLSYKTNKKMLTNRQIKNFFSDKSKGNSIIELLDRNEIYKALNLFKSFYPIKEPILCDEIDYLTESLSNLIYEVNWLLGRIRLNFNNIFNILDHLKDISMISNIINRNNIDLVGDFVCFKETFNKYSSELYNFFKKEEDISCSIDEKKEIKEYIEEIDNFLWLIDKKASYWKNDKNNIEFSNDLCINDVRDERSDCNNKKLFDMWMEEIK